MPQPDVLAPLSMPETPSTAQSLTLCEAEWQMSAWMTSPYRRVFDLALILAASPVICPLLLLIAAAVRLSSPGPAIFRQTRIGASGKPFTILKFRTMIEPNQGERDGFACTAPERITPLGTILRKLKLDELPQFFNVLRGDMSLVGPRPRIAEQQMCTFRCKPGITGAATLAFAREESFLAKIPAQSLPQYYRECVLPAKHQLDSAYMARATMSSDLHILLLTAVGRWSAPRFAMIDECQPLHRADTEPVCESEPA